MAVKTFHRFKTFYILRVFKPVRGSPGPSWRRTEAGCKRRTGWVESPCCSG
ncbi:hypothetical protein [European catfish virus]|uniref:Uncharacterized protein n=1 Tax=European catfish virus TaxID=84739 RepID=I2BFN8_9VIRU|nr:hypothetical protein A190_gp058 [European catfish virus]AFJ52341.1 hypothetical protein [European catfish virus]AMZ04887.1 hypothetical protein [European catfish virus]AMZ05023.1 hypothetical protein [European catfish virus]